MNGNHCSEGKKYWNSRPSNLTNIHKKIWIVSLQDRSHLIYEQQKNMMKKYENFSAFMIHYRALLKQMLKKPSNILTLILNKFFEMETKEVNSGNIQVLLGYLRHTLYKVSSTLQLLVQSDGPTYFFWFTFCLHGWDNYNNCKTLLKTSIILLVYLNIILNIILSKE